MTDAREIIHSELISLIRKDKAKQPWPDAIIYALTSAGFRILGPDEIDGPTVEKCAEIVERAAPEDTGKWNVYRAWALRSLPRLRALQEKRT